MHHTPRVLLVTGLTHWGRGGVQHETESLARSLAWRSVPVALASDRAVPDVPTHFPLCYPPGPHTPEQIWDAIRDFRPQVIHAVGGGVSFLRQVSRVATVPLVLTVHCVPPFERTSPFAYGRNTLYRALRDAAALPSRLAWSKFLRENRDDRVVVHSEVIARQVISRGLNPSRLVEIPLGCEPPPPPEPSPDATTCFAAADSPRLLTVAGFAHQKGVHDVLRALAPLAASYPTLRYKILGERREPKYLAWLRRLADSLSLSRHVEFLPDAPDAAKHAAMRECDLYLQPSHEEGFCLTFLEAALGAKHLIATSTGAMPAIAEGFPEIEIVPPGDVAALGRALRAALARQPDQPGVARRRESLLQRYTWAAHADAHLRLYAELTRPVEYARAA